MSKSHEVSPETEARVSAKRSKLRQMDIQRALRAARAEGYEPREYSIEPDGRLRVVLVGQVRGATVQDEIVAWAARRHA